MQTKMQESVFFHSDLMSRDKIREIIQKFMPQSADRGISLASTDLLQPKKLSLHEGKFEQC